jgi:hypothetical protein
MDRFFRIRVTHFISGPVETEGKGQPPGATFINLNKKDRVDSVLFIKIWENCRYSVYMDAADFFKRHSRAPLRTWAK